MLDREKRGHPRAWCAKLLARLRTVRSDEQGVAILMVVTTITVGLAVGGVAAVTASNAMSGSARDESSKDALAAADAGAELALLRQNQVAVSDTLPCVTLSVTGSLVAGPADASGWCPEFSGTAGDATYTYRVRAPTVTSLLSQVEIVSAGESKGVFRRVHTIVESPRATAIFANSTVLADQSITLNGNAAVAGNSATNGNIVLNNNADLCGVAQHGESGAVVVSNNASHGGADCAQSTYPSGPGTVILPPVDQGDVADPANNDNDRIDPANPAAPDTVSGNGQVTWDPVNRTLVLDSNSALTLGGNDYSLCRFELRSNTELIVAAGAKVRIFFDAPENCPTLGAGPQISLDSNSRLTTTDGAPGSLQLLVVGSPDPAVTSDNIVIDSNSQTTMPIILYAPRSAITMNSNSTLLGAVAGESLVLDSNANVSSHTDASSLELPVPLSYRQTQFVECVSTDLPTNTPSSNC